MDCDSESFCHGELDPVRLLRQIRLLQDAGGTPSETNLLGTYIYQTMVQQKHFGYAAAISVALLALAISGGVLMSIRNRRAEGR